MSDNPPGQETQNILLARHDERLKVLAELAHSPGSCPPLRALERWKSFAQGFFTAWGFLGGIIGGGIVGVILYFLNRAGK